MDRFKAYKFFAHLFSYPESGEFFSILEKFYPFEDKTPLEEVKKVDLGELQAEYTSLFIARPGGVPCKPYQSVFSAAGELMGGPAFGTQKYYSLFNLDPGNELPDRANLQLDFAAFLLKLIENAKEPAEGRRLEALFKDFFKKHILWMENLARCVEKNTSLVELKELMTLFREFLESEKKLLGLI